MFKDGDKVKLNPIYEDELELLGLGNRTLQDLSNGSIKSVEYGTYYSAQDSWVSFFIPSTNVFIPNGNETWAVPTAWLLPLEPRKKEHPLTKIFKNNI